MMNKKRKKIFYLAYFSSVVLMISGPLVSINMSDISLPITLCLLGFGLQITLIILNAMTRKKIIESKGEDFLKEKYKVNPENIVAKRTMTVVFIILAIIFLSLKFNAYAYVFIFLATSVGQIPTLYINE